MSTPRFRLATAEAVLPLHEERMSPDNQRTRFFAMSKRAPALTADRLCAPNRQGFLSLGGFADKLLVGVVEYDVDDQRPVVAEIAVAVADDQTHPIGIVAEADLLHKETAQPDPGGHAPACGCGHRTAPARRPRPPRAW
jgi:hypothetical protein